MNLEKSRELFEMAMNLLPGGVSSPVRAVKPHPFYTVRARGSRIFDVDGNEYIDYCMGYGPLILGHANREVMDKVRQQLQEGWLYGTPTPLELEMAEKIVEHYPSIDKVRFVNSGSEATMSALRVARGFTGKNKIIKIEGGFHGAHDSVLVKAGSGATTLGIPDSKGIPADFVKNTLQIPFNDLESLSTVIEKNREDIACLIMEPVMGNSGLILPENGYLSEVRKITRENDVLLIFDEVITGYRVSIGGAQLHYDIKPDITTLGKVAGGGFPFGIVGGRREIMENISPSGGIYQAGTFNGNPFVLSAGLATVEILERGDVYKKLERLGRIMEGGLKDVVEDAGKDYSVVSLKSMFCLFLGDKPLNYSQALVCDRKKFVDLHWSLLERGIFVPPSQFETCFISYAHSEDDVNRTIEAFNSCLKEL